MGKFVAGVIVGVLGVAVGAYVYIHYGFLHLEADRPGMGIERLYMNGAMDRYAGRYAPEAQNPIPPTDANLMDGIRLYTSNCAICHGGPEKPISEIGLGLYPRAPQFLKDAPDMPPNQNYWIIKHGIKRTGMPSWDKALSETELWKVITFLSQMENLEKLSPAVQEAWKSGGQKELGAQPNLTAPGAPLAPAMPHPTGPAHSH